MFHRQTPLVCCLLALLAAAVGCEDDTSTPIPPPTDQTRSTDQRRIVTLSPALTQMVVDMGFADQIVGVAQQDNAAPENTPVVGTYQNPDFEKLLSLKPTHVLTMTDKGKTPAKLTDMAVDGQFVLASYDAPERILDLSQILLLGSPTAQVIGGSAPFDPSVAGSLYLVLDAYDEAGALVERMQRQLQFLKNTTSAGNANQRVLMLLSTDPTMAVGPDTVHNDLLYGHVQAQNAAASAMVGAPTYDREKLVSLRPDVIVLLAPGDPPLQSIDDDPRLAPFRDLDIPAVNKKRIHLVNHPLTLLPSSSLPVVAAEIAKAVHPELAAHIDAAMAEALQRPSVDDGEPATEDDASAGAPEATDVTQPEVTVVTTPETDGATADAPADDTGESPAPTGGEAAEDTPAEAETAAPAAEEAAPAAAETEDDGPQLGLSSREELIDENLPDAAPADAERPAAP